MNIEITKDEAKILMLFLKKHKLTGTVEDLEVALPRIAALREKIERALSEEAHATDTST